MGCHPHSEKKPKSIATSSGNDPDMDEVNTLLMRLDTPIERWEVPLLRGAVNSLLSCRSTLFHNHTTEGLRYSYPLVQYKRVGGKAALLCIGQGVDALGDLLSVESLDTHIGQRRVVLRIESIDALAHPVEECTPPVTYRLRDWLPLNEHNHQLYQSEPSMAARLIMLERILTGNILSMFKGVGIFIPFPLRVTITSASPLRTIKYKGVPLAAMDLQFESNISLPDHIGLGKHASVGYGTVTKVRNHNSSRL